MNEEERVKNKELINEAKEKKKNERTGRRKVFFTQEGDGLEIKEVVCEARAYMEKRTKNGTCEC